MAILFFEKKKATTTTTQKERENRNKYTQISFNQSKLLCI